MRVLAIETSCDETGIALVEGMEEKDAATFRVLKNELLSQAPLHTPYGGVYPTLAKREHAKNLPLLFASFAEESTDALAVTVGPGLEPALWQGIAFAEEVARKRRLPLFPVNHMEAHLISSLVQNGRLEGVAMPVLALLISGGHTEFVYMSGWFEYQIIGETLDDAVGECFDKVARLLELPYPGGPEISRLAAQARGMPSPVVLPRPMLKSGTCDVSFSGLKTAALYALRNKILNAEEKATFAAQFEEAVGDVFVAKTHQALEHTGARTFVIGGGVAANRSLRERLQALVLEDFPEVEFRLPESAITGDNAVMIGEAALLHLLRGDWDLTRANMPLRAAGKLRLST